MERPDERIRDIEPIQPDPQLQLSQGRATGIQITLVAIACMLIVSLMVYGLSRPTTENIAAPAPDAEQTTGSAPPAAAPAAPQTGGNVAGGDNAAPKDEGTPSQQQQPAQQPVPQQQKPGAVEDDSAR
jgi:hypothetical protein